MVIVALLLLVGGGFCGWFIGQNGWDFREWGKEKDSYSMESAVSEEDEDKDKDKDESSSESTTASPESPTVPTVPAEELTLQTLCGQWNSPKIDNEIYVLFIRADRTVQLTAEKALQSVTGSLSQDLTRITLSDPESGESLEVLVHLTDGQLTLSLPDGSSEDTLTFTRANAVQNPSAASLVLREGETADGTILLTVQDIASAEAYIQNEQVMLRIEVKPTAQAKLEEFTGRLAPVHGSVSAWKGSERLFTVTVYEKFTSTSVYAPVDMTLTEAQQFAVLLNTNSL